MPQSIRVFISHSSKDKPFVKRLANDLTTFGISVWYDELSMLPGQRLRDKINKAIFACDYFLVILSNRSITCPWVQAELDSAMMRELAENEIVVVPLLLGRIRVGQLPPDLQGKTCADFRYLSSDKYDISLRRLLDTIGQSGTSARSGGYSLAPHLISCLTIEQIDLLRNLSMAGGVASLFDLGMMKRKPEVRSVHKISSHGSRLCAIADDLLSSQGGLPPLLEKREHDVGFHPHRTALYMFRDELCMKFVDDYLEPSDPDVPGGPSAFLAAYYTVFIEAEVARLGEFSLLPKTERLSSTRFDSGPLSQKEVIQMVRKVGKHCLAGGKKLPPFVFCIKLNPPIPRSWPKTSEFFGQLFEASGCVVHVVGPDS